MKIGEKLRQEWHEAKEGIHDVQRRIRQQMRVFPRRKEMRPADQPALSNPAAEENLPLPHVKPVYTGMQLRQSKPIFSSRGKDINKGTDSAA